MAALVPKIMGLASSLLNDSDKLSVIIGKGFSHFDKDGSGFIEADEVKNAVQHVLTLAHLPQVPLNMVDSVFNKVAGADEKIDQEEFTKLVSTLLAKIKGDPAPVAEAAAAAGYTAE